MSSRPLSPLFFSRTLSVGKEGFFFEPKNVWLNAFFSHRLYIISSVGLCVCLLVFSVRSFHTSAYHLCRLHFITISLLLKRNYLPSLSLTISVCFSLSSTVSRSVTLHQSASFFPSLFSSLWLLRLSGVFCSR